MAPRPMGRHIRLSLAVRSSRAECFIREFGADYARCKGVAHDLGIESRAEDRLMFTADEDVRMAVFIHRDGLVLVQDWVAFDPESYDVEDTINSLVDALGISRQEAKRRLERVDRQAREGGDAWASSVSTASGAATRCSRRSPRTRPTSG